MESKQDQAGSVIFALKADDHFTTLNKYVVATALSTAVELIDMRRLAGAELLENANKNYSESHLFPTQTLRGDNTALQSDN